MTQILQCRKISGLSEVIRDESVALCGVYGTACEVTYYSIRHEVPGYNNMVETNKEYWFSFMRTINTMSFLLAFCVDNKQLFFCHRQVSHIGHHHMVNVRDQSTQLDITITFPFLPFNIPTIIETISSCGGILLLKTQRFLLAKAK